MEHAEIRGVKCTLVTKEHINEVIRIHSESLPEDILPTLGSAFLKRYYEYIFRSGGQSVYGIFKNEDIIGFCQVSKVKISIFEILRTYPYLICNIAWNAIWRPMVFMSGVSLVVKRKRFKIQPPEVAFIAVDKRWRNMGIGSQLIAFVTDLECDSDSFLMTVTSNFIIKNIYKYKHNAKVVHVFSVFGRKYWCLTWRS